MKLFAESCHQYYQTGLVGCQKKNNNITTIGIHILHGGQPPLVQHKDDGLKPFIERVNHLEESQHMLVGVS